MHLSSGIVYLLRIKDLVRPVTKTKYPNREPFNTTAKVICSHGLIITKPYQKMAHKSAFKIMNENESSTALRYVFLT